MRRHQVCLSWSLILCLTVTRSARGWTAPQADTRRPSPSCSPSPRQRSASPWRLLPLALAQSSSSDVKRETDTTSSSASSEPRRVVIVGAGWGGLSAAHALVNSRPAKNLQVTVIDAAPAVGGLVRDGFSTVKNRLAEAGQHGFWSNYHNIYRLLRDDLALDMHQALTAYAEQGQWSPRGLEAVWPVYRNQTLPLPTGLAQAAYTQFLGLPAVDLLSALPLAAAFCEFDDSVAAWERYDQVSFRDLCVKLGVSKRCYKEAFEPMILTGLFAPGAECSAAAALGMAYFFVLQSQTAFDVQWCRGNIGDVIFKPWVEQMKQQGNIKFECSTRVTRFDIDSDKHEIGSIQAKRADGENITFQADEVILAVGAKALNSFVRYCPELAVYPELRRFANLRGTSVLATRLFLNKNITIPYSANACWGFDAGVGMTMFDIRALHGDQSPTVSSSPGAVIEIDYYHAADILAMSDDAIVTKAKNDLDNLLGIKCQQASVVDAAVVRLPEGVNWYYPGSYKYMPDLKSNSVNNLYFAGDIVRTRHGSWSQEKAFVTGVQVANLVLKRQLDHGILPMTADEPHVKLGRDLVATAREILGGRKSSRAPSLVDFLW